MFDSLKDRPRRWAIPAVWVFLSLFWIMIGADHMSENAPFRRGWLVIALWSFVLIFWLHRLYRILKLRRARMY